jgi:hypothetical protein
MKHATLGASSAHRWAYCPGSVAASADLPNTSSPFAEEGTAAHEMAEEVLGSSWPMTKLNNFENQEMANHVFVYTEYVERLKTGADLTMIEQRVDYSDWVPGGFGTADAIVLRGDTLHVIDLKYGMGVQVYAENNPQGMLYALGAYNEIRHAADVKRVVITIVQPRLDHISEWEISIPDLLKWAEWISQRAEATEEPDAPRIAGESQCKFCLAKHNCGALLKHTTDAMLTEFEDLDNLPPPDTLTEEQVGAALAAKSLIEGWLNAVQAHVVERLENGQGFPGFKLVAGRSSRSWIDEDAALKNLSEMVGLDRAMTEPKLISPPQAENVLGSKRKADIQSMIAKAEGKPTLAPDSDKRPAVNVQLSDFD